MERDGHSGDVILVSRYNTAILVENCNVKLTDITVAVSEGSLLHHPLEAAQANIEMDDCEMYGGLYAMFAHQGCKISARQCKFHNAYSMGANCMDSIGEFVDCYFFKNRWRVLQYSLKVFPSRRNFNFHFLAERMGLSCRGIPRLNAPGATLPKTRRLVSMFMAEHRFRFYPLKL